MKRSKNRSMAKVETVNVIEIKTKVESNIVNHKRRVKNSM